MIDAEALNDRLAREHSIDDYYARSPRAVRWVEERRLRIIAEMAAVRAGMRVVEIGSGGGHVLRLFPQAHLVAVDVSGVYLETARKNLAGYDVELHKGRIEDLAFPRASFDRVICSEVLEHVEDPSVIVAEIARLVAPGGRAIITVPNDPLIFAIKRWMNPLRRDVEWGGARYHLHAWRPREIRALLARHLRVDVQRGAPFDRLPIRACFLCRPREAP